VRHRIEGRLVLRFGLPAATRLRQGAAVLPAGGTRMIAVAERLEAAVVLQSVAAAARTARHQVP
jgi:hypothetical protein